ncbi:MAG: ankyrin repeat domain-containing protein [Verrucomicrobiota bacterium]
MKRLLQVGVVAIILIAAGLFALRAYLEEQGYYEDPAVALRELRVLGVAPTAHNVRLSTSNGDLDTLRILARAQADFQTPDENGQPPLMLALKNGHLHLLPILEANHWDPNTRDSIGQTPISLALDREDLPTASLLIEKGAHPNFTLPSGEMALPGYYRYKREHHLRFLLDHGANPDSPSLDNQTLLATTLQDGRADLACLLLDKGANPNTLLNGEPLLASLLLNWKNWHLSPADTTRTLGTLLVAGAHPEQPAANGQRPLQIALKNNFPAATRLLLPRSQNVSDTLWLAIDHNNIPAAQALLKKGATPDSTDASGETPLIHAIRSKNIPLLNALLSANADPNQLAPEGQPALYFAIALKNDDAALALLSHRNSPDLFRPMLSPVSEPFRDLFDRKGYFDWYCRNETGLNPLMAAVMMKRLPVAEKLLQLNFDKSLGTDAPGVVFPIQMAAENRDIKMQQLLLGVSYHEHHQRRHFIIDLSEQKVRYYKDGKIAKTSRVSTGRSTHPTPTGEFVINEKDIDKRSNIYDDAEMPYFQRFSCSPIGFHEGYTGSPRASHGCIRLPLATAKYFWKETKIGDRVTIQN